MKRWGWRAGLTKPQIDLMLMDQPLIDYLKDKSKKRDKNAWRTKHAAAWKVNQAADRWEQEHPDGDAKKKFSLEGFGIAGIGGKGSIN